MRALFYRGRHHIRTAPRPAGGLVTIDTITARIRRENWPVVFLGIDDALPWVDPRPALALAAYVESCQHALPEQLGGLSV